MITKDDAETIGGSLRSTLPLIDTWLIYDLGSEDKTVDVVKGVFSKVPGIIKENVKFDGVDAVRNRLIDEASQKADYLLILNHGCKVIYDSGLDKDALTENLYDCVLRTSQQEAGKTPILIRSEFVKHIRFEGKIRDNIVPQGGATLTYHHLKEIWVLLASNMSQGYIELLSDTMEQVVKEEQSSGSTGPGSDVELAKLHEASGEIDKAIAVYGQCAKNKKYDQESRWFSQHRKAQLMKQKGVGWDKLAFEYLLAYDLMPTRSESLFELTRHCRQVGWYNMGYMFGSMGIRNQLPTSSVVAPSKEIYEWMFADELSLCAYYAGQYREAWALGQAIDAHLNHPDDDRLKKNRSYFEKGVLSHPRTGPESPEKRIILCIGENRFDLYPFSIFMLRCPVVEPAYMHCHVPWDPDEKQMERLYRALLSFQNQVAVDCGPHLIRYAAGLMHLHPDTKIVCLRSNVDKSVQDYETWAGTSKNSWTAPDGRHHQGLWVQDIWDDAFPKYDLPRADAVRKFVTDYQEACDNMVDAFPENTRIWLASDINDISKQKEIMSFLQIEPAAEVFGPVISESPPC